MEFVNATRMSAGYNFGLDTTGRYVLVTVIKGTFVLPSPDLAVRLHDEQAPLVTADTFNGEPGGTAPMHEVDFAPMKRACDVLLVGHARTPAERPLQRSTVCLQVGTMAKQFDVVGDRVWQEGFAGISASSPAPFTAMPIHYDVAFGGLQPATENEPADAYLPNPVGRGWSRATKRGAIHGRPLPNTEESGQPVRRPSGTYRPMAFGPVGRSWLERARYAGTYDEHWREERAPFLPDDFDERYYQSAPQSQQIALPQAPLDIALTGFTHDGTRHFTFPMYDASVHVFPRAGGHLRSQAALDTIVFEPDLERFTVAWRHVHWLRRDPYEIAQVLVGKKSEAWWRARASGKAYLASLAEAGRSATSPSDV